MKVLIIIPAYNEAQNIENVVENLRNNYSMFDYVVINDGSQDETAKICRENNYNLLDLPINLGSVKSYLIFLLLKPLFMGVCKKMSIDLPFMV